MKRTAIKPISNKRQAQLKEYRDLVLKLRTLCNNRSELTRHSPDWQSEYIVDPHHIKDRINHNLLDPFNIIMLTREEHDAQDSNDWEDKQRLLEFIQPIRLRQGFVKE